MERKGHVKGVLFAGLGATLWGINGAFADIVFSAYQAPVEWVVGTRLLLAGVVILIYVHCGLKQNIFNIFKSRESIIKLCLFSLIGMIGCQYLFFLSIGTNGAGLATILQFTSPIFIYLYLVLKKEKSVQPKELMYIAFTIIGVLLIVTKGKWSMLAVSGIGLMIGLGAAIGVAFYTLQPRQLLKEYGATIVTGWGMLIGGIVFQLIHPIWQPGFEVDVKALCYMGFIIVVGTACAFSFYLASINYIDASLANIIAAMEPLVANVLTVVLLGQTWTLIQLIGMAIVISSVVLFANYSEKN